LFSNIDIVGRWDRNAEIEPEIKDQNSNDYPDPDVLWTRPDNIKEKKDESHTHQNLLDTCDGKKGDWSVEDRLHLWNTRRKTQRWVLIEIEHGIKLADIWIEEEVHAQWMTPSPARMMLSTMSIFWLFLLEAA